MITPHAAVITSALVLCFVFSALLFDAVMQRRRAAADLAWFYASGSFNIPQVSQRSALRAFGSLFKRRAAPPSARRKSLSSATEDHHDQVSRNGTNREPATLFTPFYEDVSDLAARKCAAHSPANQIRGRVQC